jgi:hypothetical protein
MSGFLEAWENDPRKMKQNELGNLVPNGILGVDGYCFDLYEDDAFLASYVERRIEEAHACALRFA